MYMCFKNAYFRVSIHVNIYTNKSVHGVPNSSCTLFNVDKTSQQMQDVMEKLISCRARAARTSWLLNVDKSKKN